LVEDLAMIASPGGTYADEDLLKDPPPPEPEPEPGPSLQEQIDALKSRLDALETKQEV